jgi:hypothetical protein
MFIGHHHVIIGVTCGEKGCHYDQLVELRNHQDVVVLGDLFRAIPCCGMCGSRDITYAVRKRLVCAHQNVKGEPFPRFRRCPECDYIEG